MFIKDFMRWAYSFSEKEDDREVVLSRFVKGMIRIAEADDLDRSGKLRAMVEKLLKLLPAEQNKFDIMHRITEINDEMFAEVFRRNGDTEDRINRALNYIEKNIRKNIRLEDVADHINISPYYMSKIFKKEMKVNFINYVANRKIEIAKEMLVDTTLPIINIAIELSYSDANYFGKAFKKVVGVSPNEYRRVIRAGGRDATAER
jgi:YesN/AraC family two-component response regulator